MSYKALICITTCNRLNEVKKYILPYIQFCNKDESFSFLLSLDGNNMEYIDFCNAYNITLLYSEEREGVGISKNRVLKQFQDFEYYFFIDDDIELIDANIFELFITTFLVTGYHHFSYSHLLNATKIEHRNHVQLRHNNFGGGQFNFYTRSGLYHVGGWHTCFAKYKRFGHTEHTYRFYHSGLTPSPFIFIDEARGMHIIHDPPHVTNLDVYLENPDNELIMEEEELIKQKTVFFPITTISAFHFNDFDMDFNSIIDDFLKKNTRKYPFVRGMERMKCFSEYYFFKFTTTKSFPVKVFFLITSFVYDPLSNQIKHFIKKKLRLA
jgi:hypothetical protein